MVKLEQQRAEAERMREAEERKKRKEQAQRITRMLEAAFEGNTMEIKSTLEEVCTLSCGFLHCGSVRTMYVYIHVHYM